MRHQIALASAGGTLLLGLLMYCGPNVNTDSITNPDSGPPCDDSGANCPCDPTTFTQAVDCYTGPRGSNGKGICQVGKRSCIADIVSGNGTTTDCVGEITPQPEICDYLDNDCNGIIDDVPGTLDAAVIAQCQSPTCDPNNSDAGITCFAGTPYNACKAGLTVCGPQRKFKCEPFLGQIASPEICNGWDDDCNDMIDDNPTDVGKCQVPFLDDGGNIWTLPDGGTVVGECLNSTSSCIDAGLQCPPSDPAAEKCDGLDNDCNGVIDNGSCATNPYNEYYCCSYGKGYGYCTSYPYGSSCRYAGPDGG